MIKFYAILMKPSLIEEGWFIEFVSDVGYERTRRLKKHMNRFINPYTLLLAVILMIAYYFGIPLLFSDDNELNPINNDKAVASYESRFTPPPLPKSLDQVQGDSEIKTSNEKVKTPKQNIESWQKNYVDTQIHSATVRKQMTVDSKKSGEKQPRRLMIKGTELKKSASTNDYQPSRGNEQNSQKNNQQVASRWIPQLSGQKARIQVTKHGKTLKGCPNNSEACADRNSKPDHISVVGVVVETEKADHSDKSSTEVHRGNYAENTPAIYVQ